MNLPTRIPPAPEWQLCSASSSDRPSRPCFPSAAQLGNELGCSALRATLSSALLHIAYLGSAFRPSALPLVQILLRPTAGSFFQDGHALVPHTSPASSSAIRTALHHRRFTSGAIRTACHARTLVFKCHPYCRYPAFECHSHCLAPFPSLFSPSSPRLLGATTLPLSAQTSLIHRLGSTDGT